MQGRICVFALFTVIAGNDPHQSGQVRKFKAANFDYCTFSGVFTTRNDKALVKHSGLLCLDFDHLQNVDLLFNRLLQDDYFDTLLLFRSSSGDGLKWIISIDVTQGTGFVEHDMLTGMEKEIPLDKFPKPEDLGNRYRNSKRL